MADDKTQKNTPPPNTDTATPGGSNSSSGSPLGGSNDSAQGSKDDGKGQPFDVAPFLAVLNQLRTTRKPISAAPTSAPKNFMEQIQYYENGATRRLYIYISATWRYVALT